MMQRCCGGLVTVLTFFTCAIAAEGTWNQPGGGAWHAAGNWLGAIPNAPGDVAIFAVTNPVADADVTIDRLTTLGQIEYSNLDRITLQGTGPLVFDTGDDQAALVRLNPLAFELRVNADMAFGDEETLIADVSQGSRLVFRGGFGDTSVDLVKEGPGRLELSGDSPLWAGTLEVNAGDVFVTGANALGSPSRGTSLTRGVLTLKQASVEPIDVAGGTLIIGDTANVHAGPIHVTRGDVNIDGLISSVITVDGGELNVNRGDGVGGTILLQGGRVNFITAERAHSEITMSGGRLASRVKEAGLSGRLTLASDSNIIQIPDGTSFHLSGGTAGTGDLRIVSSGTLTVDGAGLDHQGGLYIGGDPARSTVMLGSANRYSGTTTIRGGTTFVQNREAFGSSDAGTLIESGGVFLSATGIAEPIRVLGGYLALDVDRHAGPVELAGGTLETYGPLGHGAWELTSPLQVDSLGILGNRDGPLLLSGGVSGEGLLLVRGFETTHLSGPIDFNGEVRIESGTLVVTADSLVSTPIRVVGDTLSIERDTAFSQIDLLPRARLTSGPDATFTVPKLDPSGAYISASLAGVETLSIDYLGTTTLERIGRDFDGSVRVVRGLLRLTGDDALGSPVGATHVLGRRNAAVVLRGGTTIRDEVHLNNVAGFAGGGGLVVEDPIGGLDKAVLEGDVWLGDRGSTIGNYTEGGLSTLELRGAIHGGTLVKSGFGNLNIAGDGNTYTGATIVREGSVRLVNDGRLRTTSRIAIGGPFGAVIIDNRGARNLADRIAGHIPIELGGGVIEMWAGPDGSSEVLGPLTFLPGDSAVRFDYNASGGARLTMQSMTRSPGATVEFQQGLETFVTEPPALTHGIIGGWARIANGFATYGPQGIMPLPEDRYVSELDKATPTDNVYLLHHSATLTGDRHINSLRLFNAGLVDLVAHTLTVDSGGLVIGDGPNQLTNGRLTAGTGPQAELIVHAGSSLDIDADIVDNVFGPVGLTVSGSRSNPNTTVDLRGTNTYTGPTIVNGPVSLIISAPNAAPSRGDLAVHSGSYVINLPAARTVNLGNVLLDGGELSRNPSNATSSISARSWDIRSGTIRVPLTGDAPLRKTTPGIAYLESSSGLYQGDIFVDDGVLVTRAAGPLGQGTTHVNPEGRLVIDYSVPVSGRVKLAGGEIAGGGSGRESTFSGPVDVSADSAVLLVDGLSGVPAFGSRLKLSGSISGSGSLTVDGPQGTELMLIGDNRQYTGDMTIVGSTVHATQFALGRGTVSVVGHGTISLDGPLVEGALNVTGGTLTYAGDASTNQPTHFNGPLEVSGSSRLVRNASDLAIGRPTTLRDETRLRIENPFSGIRPGIVELTGLTVGSNTQIAMHDGVLRVKGHIASAAVDSSLRIDGHGQLQLDGSVRVQEGQALGIKVGDSLTQLSIDSELKSLWGGGTIRNDVVISGAGVLSPGDVVGSLVAAGSAEWGFAGIYDWQIRDALGVAGDSAGWDLLRVGQILNITATQPSPFVVRINSEGESAESGSIANFDPTASYDWLLATAAFVEGFDPNIVTIDAVSFVQSNPIPEDGRFLLQQSGGDLLLRYDPHGADSVPLVAGDANRNLSFDQLDLVQVLIAGKYLTGQPATWGEGDWNGAPGGNRVEPPMGDGLFDQFDIVAALMHNVYLSGPYGASGPSETAANRTAERSGAMAGPLFVDSMLSADFRAAPGRSSDAQFTAIPEPASALLLLLGILAAVMRQFRGGPLKSKRLPRSNAAARDGRLCAASATIGVHGRLPASRRCLRNRRASTALPIVAILCLATVAPGTMAADGTWNRDGGGIWSNPENWRDGLPIDAGNTAVFDDVHPPADAVITLDVPVSLGALRSLNPHELHVVGSHPLTLDNGETGVAVIQLQATPGSISVYSPLVLASSLEATLAPGTVIDLVGAIEGASDLTQSGEGTLLLSGDNRAWTGLLQLNSGTTVVNHPQGLPRAGATIAGGQFDVNVTPATAPPTRLRAGTMRLRDPQNPFPGDIEMSGGILSGSRIGLAGTLTLEPGEMLLDSRRLDLEHQLDVGEGTQISLRRGITVDRGDIHVQGGSLVAQGDFTNNGTVSMDSGTLEILGTLRGSGTLDNNGGFLTVNHIHDAQVRQTQGILAAETLWLTDEPYQSDSLLEIGGGRLIATDSVVLDAGRLQWTGGSIRTPLFRFGQDSALAVGLDLDVAALVDGSAFRGATVDAGPDLDLGRIEVVNGATLSQGNTARLRGLSVGGSKSSGSYELFPDAELKVNGTVVVGDGGEGVFRQWGGTVSRIPIVPIPTLVVAKQTGSRGRYELHGGTLEGWIIVGESGTGTFHQTGGTLSGILRVGRESTGAGEYLMDGGLVHTQGMTIGDGAARGRFVQRGGLVQLDRLLGMGSTESWPDSDYGALYDLLDGEIRSSPGDWGLTLGATGPALFQQHGGTVDIGVLHLGYRADAEYRLTDGQFSTRFLFVGNPHEPGRGRFVMTGGQVDLLAPSFPEGGQLNMSNGDWVQTGGELTVGTIDTTHRGQGGTFYLTDATVRADEFFVGDRLGFHGTQGQLIVSGQAPTLEVGTLELTNYPSEDSTAGIRIDTPTADIRITKEFHIGDGTYLEAVPGTEIRLAGARWINESRQPSLLRGLSNVAITFENLLGRPNLLEVAGEDVGPVASGFTENFDLALLQIGDGRLPTTVTLADEWDNQLDGPEALYVDRLVLMPEARLNLQDLNLYYLQLDDRGGSVLSNGGRIQQVVVPLQAGDANQDFVFDQSDVVQVLVAGKYLTSEPATWGDGDWNGAPGGALGEPPAGDGVFDQLDIVAALRGGAYLTGPYFARGRSILRESITESFSLMTAIEPIFDAVPAFPAPTANQGVVPEPSARDMFCIGLLFFFSRAAPRPTMRGPRRFRFVVSRR